MPFQDAGSKPSIAFAKYVLHNNKRNIDSYALLAAAAAAAASDDAAASDAGGGGGAATAAAAADALCAFSPTPTHALSALASQSPHPVELPHLASGFCADHSAPGTVWLHPEQWHGCVLRPSSLAMRGQPAPLLEG